MHLHIHHKYLGQNAIVQRSHSANSCSESIAFPARNKNPESNIYKPIYTAVRVGPPVADHGPFTARPRCCHVHNTKTCTVCNPRIQTYDAFAHVQTVSTRPLLGGGGTWGQVCFMN